MPERLDAEEVRRRVDGGAMLICAYDDEAKCRQAGVEASITLAQFRKKLGSIPKSQEIVFFCA